jgi:UDP-2,3-diacylglucosamine hydrolase
VPAYFASDVHLRLDHPERSRRFARWVNGLDADDTLTIVGDLCDFWMGARQLPRALEQCAGLQALAAFRARGGPITVLPGNHDFWLGRFYEEQLGVRFLHEPFDVEVYGLRLHLVHGHRLGARRVWKGWMESHAFLRAFRLCPSPLASALDRVLERNNESRRLADEARHLAVYRRFVAGADGPFDLVVIGHVHEPVDDPSLNPRMVVLGGWHHQSSYLKVDASGATLVVEPDPATIPC